MKCKADGLLSVVQRHGVSTAEEYAAFINEQIYALKEVVEREHLDCEFELRRTFDVFLDDVEAENITKGFRASLAAGHKYTRDRALVDEKMAEQVSMERVTVTGAPVACLPRRNVAGRETYIPAIAMYCRIWESVGRAQMPPIYLAHI